MDKKDLYQLIYDFLAIRMKIGCYKNGDQILIKPLADFFHISTIPIRNAFTLLEQHGYIKIEKNQKAIVTYQSSDKKQEIHIPHLSLSEFNDINISYQFILSEIIWHALPLSYETKQNSQSSIRAYLQKYNSISSTFSVLFFKNIIEIFGNPLLLELHIDIFLFTYPTTVQVLQNKNNAYKTFPQTIRQQIYSILDLYEAGKQDDTYNMILQLYDNEKTVNVSSTTDPNVSQFPFRWNKSRIRFQIASDFIAQCHKHYFKEGELTPPMMELAKHYRVSYMTMRRTFSLLNKLGVVETVNGVGTRVLTLEEGSKKIQWENKEIRKHMLSFLYTMQILVILAKKTSKAMLAKLADDEMHEMIQELNYTLENKISAISFGIWLKHVIIQCEHSALVEIYRHLASLLVWGYPLRYLNTVLHFPTIIYGLINALKQKDDEKFAEIMESYCFITFVNAKKTMLKLGISDAESIKTPNVVITDIL